MGRLAGFGYRQIVRHLRGEYTLAEAVAETKKLTRRFVHRQYAWFPLADSGILWLSVGPNAFETAAANLRAWLTEPGVAHSA